jgi:hypothetical protein
MWAWRSLAQPLDCRATFKSMRFRARRCIQNAVCCSQTAFSLLPRYKKHWARTPPAPVVVLGLLPGRARAKIEQESRGYCAGPTTGTSQDTDGHRFLVGLCLELRLANSPPTKDCTAAMGYCMTSDHDTAVSISPLPPQDGRWAIFAPAGYKNMALGDPGLTSHCLQPIGVSRSSMS